tara:strand:- start:2062 stop:3063 length:1002 start_codon:yes stop_codon:yes gene_type:complete
MNIENINIFICNNCKSSDLKIVNNDEKSIEKSIYEGTIICNICQHAIKIVEGVPRFVPESNYSDSFGYQWNKHYNTQLDSYTKLSISEDRLLSTTGWTAEDINQSTILEAGSGSGRFTEVLLKYGAKVISFDYSKAIDVVKNNFQDQEHKLTVFQGDIMRIPLKKKSYSKVVCLGVLQHTKNPKDAFMHLSSLVAENGELVIDIYKKTFFSILQWKYILRPITKRINTNLLYRIIKYMVPIMLPFVILLKKLFGRVGGRLSPICDYSDLGLSPSLNKAWSILDTFDMYSPEYDKPQTRKAVLNWFSDAGFVEIEVKYGLNGIIAKGRLNGTKA